MIRYFRQLRRVVRHYGGRYELMRREAISVAVTQSAKLGLSSVYGVRLWCDYGGSPP